MKYLIGVAVTVLLLAGGWLVLGSNNAENEPPATTNNHSESNPESADTNDQPALISSHLAGANNRGELDATNQTEVTVEIGDMYFNPTILTVSAGTTVTWVNSGSVSHDVTSAANSPLSGLGSDLLARGESYSFTFETPGTYLYFCTPHPDEMRAVVQVVQQN